MLRTALILAAVWPLVACAPTAAPGDTACVEDATVASADAAAPPRALDADGTPGEGSADRGGAPLHGGPTPLLPGHRIVGFYGNPLSERMGVLGRAPYTEMLDRLAAQAAEWSEADPAHPVLPALHLVSTVAQPVPGPDGLYRARTADHVVDRVAGWAESRGWLLFLDLQIGRSTVRAEVEHVLPLLRRDHVHLALDPEFAVQPGQIPGRVIGSLDAEDINTAIELLAGVVEAGNLTPKVLVVHRFTVAMLRRADRIRTDPRVQVVVDMDGFGAPQLKRDSYRVCVTQAFAPFAGFKIFYTLDRPVMSVADVLRLEPQPLFVLYQ